MSKTSKIPENLQKTVNNVETQGKKRQKYRKTAKMSETRKKYRKTEKTRQKYRKS